MRASWPASGTLYADLQDDGLVSADSVVSETGTASGYNLISLPIEADCDVAADLVDLWGQLNPQSLLLGLPAFALRNGVLSVEELPGFEEFPDDDEANDDTDDG